MNLDTVPSSLLRSEDHASQTVTVDAPEVDGFYGGLARIVELGSQKGFVRFADLLEILPDSTNDADQLDEIFAALFSAGIPYLDDEIEGQGEDKQNDEQDKRVLPHPDDGRLERMDANDLIGLLQRSCTDPTANSRGRD